jgi:hypothetical protein
VTVATERTAALEGHHESDPAAEVEDLLDLDLELLESADPLFQDVPDRRQTLVGA